MISYIFCDTSKRKIIYVLLFFNTHHQEGPPKYYFIFIKNVINYFISSFLYCNIFMNNIYCKTCILALRCTISLLLKVPQYLKLQT